MLKPLLCAALRCLLTRLFTVVPAAATFILINVRSTVVGYLEAQREPPQQLTAEELLPELSQ
jgi:hypothetical protein